MFCGDAWGVCPLWVCVKDTVTTLSRCLSYAHSLFGHASFYHHFHRVLTLTSAHWISWHRDASEIKELTPTGVAVLCSALYIPLHHALLWDSSIVSTFVWIVDQASQGVMEMWKSKSIHRTYDRHKILYHHFVYLEILSLVWLLGIQHSFCISTPEFHYKPHYKLAESQSA